MKLARRGFVWIAAQAGDERRVHRHLLSGRVARQYLEQNRERIPVRDHLVNPSHDDMHLRQRR